MSDIDNFREYQISLVAEKTEALTEKHGFVFGGSTFDLDPDSRQKWLALRTLKPDLTFPLDISPRTGVYSLEATDLDAFLQAGLSVVMGYKSSGRMLRLQMESASTILELCEISDDRT